MRLGDHFALAVGILFAMSFTQAHCQEAIRMSLAGEQAAAAQKNATGSNYYNLQFGPVRLRLQGQMGIELNDNANYSSTAPDADIGFRPNLNVKADWRISERNNLGISTGVGYVQYIHDPGLSHLNINSASGLAFNAYAGDFVFNLHDRFSAVDYETQDPSISASLIRLENTPGIAAAWDLNQLILTAGYDHDTFNSLNGSYQYSDNSSELFNGKAAFLISSTSRLGLEAGGGLTAYDPHILDNSTHYSVGPFYQSRLTPYLNGEVHAGLASYQFDHNGTVTNAGDFLGWYASISVSHQINDSFVQSLAAGRKIQLGINADLSEDYFVTYQATWAFIRNVFTTLSFSFEHGNTSGGAVEKYNRYCPGLTMGWHLSDKFLAEVTYDFLQKKSGVSSLSYAQNRVLLNLTYDF